jgi:hypothetical protein
MSKRSLRAGLVLAAVMVGVVPVRAQEPIRLPADNTPYGTTAAEFLLFPASARGAALGNGYSALVTDVSAVHFNPSGLALLERPGLQASTMSYVAETRYSWVAAGFPLGGARTLGVSIANFGFSDQPVYTVEDPEGESGEVYSVSQTAVGLTYAQRFSDRFAAGITAKFVNDQLGGTAGRAGAVDFGTLFTASIGGRPFRAAFTVQNLGTTLKHTGNALDVVVDRPAPSDQQDVPQAPAAAQLQSKGWSLPVTFRVALAYDAFATTSSRLVLLSEFNQPNNTDPGFNLGGEYQVGLGSAIRVAGRVGFTYAPDNNLDAPGPGSADYAGFDSSPDGEGMDGFSAGGGVRWASRGGFGLSVDYAYRSMGLLGGVNMVSVGVNW